MTKEKQIKFEQGDYWVCETDNKTYEVYRNGITHAERVAIIGYKGDEGLTKAKAEIERRMTV